MKKLLLLLIVPLLFACSKEEDTYCWEMYPTDDSMIQCYAEYLASKPSASKDMEVNYQLAKEKLYAKECNMTEEKAEAWLKSVNEAYEDGMNGCPIAFQCIKVEE